MSCFLFCDSDSAVLPDNRKVVLETPGLTCHWLRSHIGMNSMVPEINIIDENPPIFDLEWMDQCADKVSK